MAIITSIQRNYTQTTKFRKQVEVKATFLKIDDNCVQIQTNSSSRSQTKSRSQTIRLNKEASKDLIDLLKNAFNL